jgi:hypothetical protein
MTDLTITELELTPGVWTPAAQILCIPCYKKSGRVWAMGAKEELDDERFKEQPLDDAMDSTVAECSECGKDIWMPYKISWEQKIVAALKEKGFDARMEQTGGMCSAAALYLPGDEDGGQKYVWITESEDCDQPHNAPSFIVGFYHIENPYGDDIEGDYETCASFSEAVALVEKIVKEGRLNV